MTQFVRVLSIFDRETEHLMKDIVIEAPIEILREIFGIEDAASEDNYNMIYAYPIRDKEAKKLQKYISESIDLDKYYYFLDSYEE